eukprot:scaffold24027_cov60-Phaeocystis_antarctica.AAC.7
MTVTGVGLGTVARGDVVLPGGSVGRDGAHPGTQLRARPAHYRTSTALEIRLAARARAQD